MNPRQRRGVLLMIVAGIGAIAVFFTVVSYTNKLYQELGTMRTVLQLKKDVPAYSAITEESYTKVEVPAKYYSKKTFIEDVQSDVAPGELPVSSAPLPKGAYLQKGMVIPAPELEAGDREIAVMVDAETGVAGKVRAGSKVDIYATFDEESGKTKDKGSCAVRALTDIQVLDVGVVRSETDEKTGGTTGSVPVTFRLDPKETLILTQVESFSKAIRLGLVSPQGSGAPELTEFCSTDFSKLTKEAQQQQQGGGGQ